MQKTKLGISVELLGAIICLLALWGGTIPIVLLVGYVLLREENEWLRKCALKVLLIMIMFSAVISIVGLVPDLFSLISSVLGVFNLHFSFSFVSSIFNVIVGALSILKTCLLLLLGLKAFNQGTIAISIVDKIISKHV